MEEYDIYRDISERTGGDIYIGVVGPVRSGKSTFITNFMEKLVLPSVEDGYALERMKDELPQSASGKTIMTTQPKFVPSEAVSVKLGEGIEARLRLVDCVGYLIDGAGGHLEGEEQRMVKTPWQEDNIPFERAAEIGTQRVIEEHSTIGIVMTTDGSIATELPRKSYEEAEERTIGELKKIGKPFVVILNSSVPHSDETLKLAAQLGEKYRAQVLPLDVLHLEEDDITQIFKNVLMEFPLVDIEVSVNKWMQALPPDNRMIQELIQKTMESGNVLAKMSDYMRFAEYFEGSEYFKSVNMAEVEFGRGSVAYSLEVRPDLFYRALSEECETELKDDFELMASIKGLVTAKRSYDKLKDALDEVRENGYGVVTPSIEEMTLDEPEMVKQGGQFGVKFRATAPSLHIMRVDIETEMNSIVGNEEQSEALVKSLLARFENDPKDIWQTDFFGKSLHSLVNDSLRQKLAAMPNDTQKKMRKTLSRIINEGKGGVICILL